MGNSGSRGKHSKVGGSDSCMGNRRVRTVTLSIVIGVFFVMAIPYVAYEENIARKANETAEDFNLGFFNEEAADRMEDVANAWAFNLAGCAVCIVGAILAVILFLVPNCEDTLGRIAGVVLLIGGILYIIGWVWYLIILNDTIPWDSDVYPDKWKEQNRAQMAVWAGEMLLPAVSAVLLGADAAFQFYENESSRLGANLGLLMTVSILCFPSFYAKICSEEDENDYEALGQQCTPDGVAFIATGYVILFGAAIANIIVQCCCKGSAVLRIIIAIALMIGGGLAAVGYFVWIGADEAELGETDYTDEESDGETKKIVYYIGYSVLLVGLAVVWALDIALNDFKAMKR